MAGADRSTDGARLGESIFELLARERRARLKAERRMLSIRGELMRANDSLDAHARRLAAELRPLRREAETARGEVGRAVDEARLAGSRLHDAFEASSDGFAIYDSGLRLVEANARYLAPFAELEEVRTGIAYRRLLELAVDEGIFDIGMVPPGRWVEAMIERARAEAPEPMVLQLWDGSCKRLTLRRTAGGDVVSLSVDITQTLEDEAELEEERHRAEAAVRAKKAFLSNMSHELRTPLGGILGMSQLLAEDGLTEEQREQLAVIQASGEALLAIVDDVLDLGRMETDGLVLRREAFDLHAVMRDVERILRPWAMQRGLAFEAAAAEGVPPRVVGDVARVRQVLANLAGNAVKFTEAGRVAIRVEETGRPGPGVSRVAFTVEDTGVGIAPADLDRIFAAFEQAETERDRSHDGAGLGLTVTRRLVELMGGELQVESRPGEGSTFTATIDLPVAEGPAGAEAEAAPPPVPSFRRRADDPPPGEPGGAEPPADAPAPVPGGDRRMRVLAAEDNRANRLILTRMLAGLDLDLSLVESGAAAVEAFERERPDLILMDISMPGMDGTEATRRIRALEGEGSRVPIVAMTAHSLPGDVESFRAAGMDVHLPKPMRKDDVRGLVLSHAPTEARSPDVEAG